MQTWEIQRKERSVPSAGKLSTTGQRGTDTCVFILVSVVLFVCLVLDIDFFVTMAGEKPYPCGFCGRRFRTNYNKLGHEKKCPDRHARAILQPAAVTPDSPSVVPNVVYR